MFIVIPLSGLGSRFADAGFKFPKPIVEVHGEPMISVVIKNLLEDIEMVGEDVEFIFITQDWQMREYDLGNVISRAVGSDGKSRVCHIIPISGTTAGAACTCLLAAGLFNTDEKLMIANSDQLVLDREMGMWYSQIRESKDDGMIMTFTSSHPRWSYARVEEGIVKEVAEKSVISSFASTGIYYYAHGRDFFEAASRMISKDIRVKGEFYVCPVYNELILDGKQIGVYPVTDGSFHGLGTPEDLSLFLNRK